MDRTVGFIDVGTNSVHMLVVRFYEGDMGTPVYQDKEAIRLGHSLFTTGQLDEAVLDKAGKVLRSFASIARGLGADEVRAYATCAAREAPNSSALELLARSCGIDIRIISGPEEAHITRLGVIGPVAPRRTLLVDIGGGSTEITLADGSDDLVSCSFRLGAIRMAFASGVDQSGKVSAHDYDFLRRTVDNEITSQVGRIRECGFDVAVGSSGTLMAIASAIAARRGDGNDSYFTLEELESLMRYLCRMTASQRAYVSKIGASRADIILGGGAIAEEIMFRLGIQRMEISSNGLREGMRVAYLVENGWPCRNIRESSVMSLVGRFNSDRVHGDNVARISDLLFDSFARNGLVVGDAGLKEFMRYAAYLNEVGAVAGRRSKGELTSLIIRNSAMIGFEPDELEVIAFLAYVCRGPVPALTSKQYLKLPQYTPVTLSRCAMLLKIAEISDRGRDGAVSGVEVEVVGSAIHLVLVTSSDASLAMWKLASVRDEFHSVFGMDVIVSSRSV